MGKQLTDQILKALDRIEWPEQEVASEHGRHVFFQAIERVDEYKGNPKQLLSILRLLQTGDSKPYAYAGVAYVLIEAAKDRGSDYDPSSLDAAMEWLEKAQALEPEIIEINWIEALIYIYAGRLDDARLVLDYLTDIDPYNYYLHLAEVAYWISRKDKDESVKWIETTSQSAVTIPQRLRMRAKLGDVYLNAKDYEKAVEVLKEAIHFDKENVALWHRISIAYYQLDNFKEAGIANQRTLKIQAKHSGALKLQELIKRKGGTGGLRRLLGG